MVKLPKTEDCERAAKCVLTGFGATNSEQTAFPERLQKLNVPIIVRHGCKVPFHESRIFAGSRESGYGPAAGDAGGPLVCKHNADGSGDYYLHAINNAATIPPGKADEYDGYVDVVKMLGWIDYASLAFEHNSYL